MALLATSGASRPLGSDAWVPARGDISDDGVTVPPTNVPPAAGSRALVRHQQLKWWMPTAPMIDEIFWISEKLRAH
jgi:hypothetical protein